MHGRYLLRVNERGEYELLGGKLEHGDATLADRVRQEFLEESGVTVVPGEVREPWFFLFGDRPVLIVPLQCNVLSVPPVMFDQDGGQLEWVDATHLGSIALPNSYLASIRGERPRKMTFAGNPGPRYDDDLFGVALVVRTPNSEELHEVRDPCDLAGRARELGYPSARFRTVRYQRGSALEVVYDIDEEAVERGA